MHRLLAPLVLAALALPLLPGASLAAKEVAPPSPNAAPMAEAVNRFGLDLYSAVRNPEGNLFFSPYSVAAALGMTREGARGKTAAEMDAVFHFPKRLAQAQQALSAALTPPKVQSHDDEGEPIRVPAYRLNIANALWGQEGFPFLPEFTASLKQRYGAPLYRIDFRQQAAARKAINDWVEKQTRDKIKDIVPAGQPTPDTRLALANAIYFKANWDEKFSKRGTKEAPWHGPEGTSETAKLMWRVDSFRYAEDDDVQIAEIPYKGRKSSMVVILPKRADGLAGLEQQLTHETLEGWLGRLAHRRLDLKLPRFAFTTSLDLTRTLAGMGMPLAFDARRADFTGMTAKEPLFIGSVLHKAFVAVDEEGTEAAAATVVMMRAGSAPPSTQPIPFVADHPFLFLIRHAETGAILFLGRVMDPVEA